jgi:hypothetical protein
MYWRSSGKTATQCIIGGELPISPGNLSEGIEPRHSQKQWDLQEHLQQGRYVYIKRTTVFKYLCKTLNIYLKFKKQFTLDF